MIPKGTEASVSDLRGRSLLTGAALLFFGAVLFSWLMKGAVRGMIYPLIGSDTAGGLIYNAVYYLLSSLLPSAAVLLTVRTGCFPLEVAVNKEKKDKNEKRRSSALLFIMALTAPFFSGLTVSMLFDRGNASLEGMGAWEIFLMLISSAVIPSVCEELFYRGVLTSLAYSVFGRAWAVILPAAVFSASHLDLGTSSVALFTGVFIGLMYIEGAGLKRCVLCHFFNNAFALFSRVSAEDKAAVFTVSGYVLSAVFLTASVLYLFLRHREKAK